MQAPRQLESSVGSSQARGPSAAGASAGVLRRGRPGEHRALHPPAQLAHALHHCSCWQPERPERQWQRRSPAAGGPAAPGSRALALCSAGRLPSQAESLFNPTDSAEALLSRVPVAEAPTRSVSDLDYLTELLAIQQSDGPKNIGFFGTRNMGVTHQKLVEILSYAYASTGNHIYTSGSIGTNAAVIKGALRANCPDKLTVILPQSLRKQPAESQDLLKQVSNLVEMPENDDLSLLEASRICNQKIISRVQQIICFAFHDSRLLLETCHHAKDLRKIVTLFYLD